MEAVEAASSAINDAFGQRILVLDFFHLLVNNFKTYSHHPDDSQQKRSKCKGSLVVLDAPNETLAKTEVASGVLCGCEIPCACSNDDCVLE